MIMKNLDQMLVMIKLIQKLKMMKKQKNKKKVINISQLSDQLYLYVMIFTQNH